LTGALHENPAVVIVDMLKDTLEGAHPMPIKELGREIVPASTA